MRLLYAELLKIRTAPRTTLGLVLGLLALVALGSGSTASSAGGQFASEIAVWDVLEVASTAGIFTLILGVLIVTWEYRHGTITPTFLVTPRRERVVIAKVVTSFVVGAVLAVAAIVLALGMAQFFVDLDIQRGHWELIGRIVFASAAWAVLGVGLGAAVQSQVGGIVIAFVYFLVAEPLLAWRAGDFADYFPGAAFDRLIARGTIAAAEGEIPEDTYSLSVAALLVAAYALAATAVGGFLADRRDVS